MIGDAGFLPDPTVEGVAAALEAALSGASPPTDPSDRARQFDWDEVAEQALSFYTQVCRDG